MKTKKNAVSAVKAVNEPKPVVSAGTKVTLAGAGGGSETAAATTSSSTATAVTTTPTTRLPKGFQEDLQDLLQGIEAVIPDGGALAAVNGSYTKADMVSELQSFLALYADVTAQETTLQAARVTLKAAIPDARQYFAELKGVLTGFFHAGNPQLVQFGFKPKKAAAPRTAAKKAAAVVRGAETRVLRGTLGKKAKLAVKYTGPVTAAALPSTAPAASSTSAGAPAEPLVLAVAPPKPAGE